jgi:hypothetical protein
MPSRIPPTAHSVLLQKQMFHFRTAEVSTVDRGLRRQWQYAVPLPLSVQLLTLWSVYITRMVYIYLYLLTFGIFGYRMQLPLPRPMGEVPACWPAPAREKRQMNVGSPYITQHQAPKLAFFAKTQNIALAGANAITAKLSKSFRLLASSPLTLFGLK